MSECIKYLERSNVILLCRSTLLLIFFINPAIGGGPAMAGGALRDWPTLKGGGPEGGGRKPEVLSDGLHSTCRQYEAHWGSNCKARYGAELELGVLDVGLPSPTLTHNIIHRHAGGTACCSVDRKLFRCRVQQTEDGPPDETPPCQCQSLQHLALLHEVVAAQAKPRPHYKIYNNKWRQKQKETLDGREVEWDIRMKGRQSGTLYRKEG
ncbi:hypothetical protein MAR_016569 [Mya arenaria]|uniref:Uncharacterized protein n=1 Tax=Mya arenaria TaxID=6604 RepID=A0ABY7FK77_MYAAR|nr:hypothetical protein MAR_016569 [Mya arenaria]